jgi:putative flavoprotein involved in K+ transport
MSTRVEVRGMLDAIVVGAGQAGLGASWHFARRGIEHVVLERGRVGETWRTQRWDSFALNTPSWMNRLPGEEADAEPRDGFLGRDAWVAHLEAYASGNRAPVRTGAEVTRVEQRPDGTFRVDVVSDASAAETLESRSVVVASGIQRVHRVPRLAGALPFSTLSIHTAHYLNPGQLPAGAILVVGSAQSGVQIAEDLIAAGRTVYVSASRVARLRRRYRGRDTLEWLLPAGFWDQRVESLPDPSQRLAPQPLTSGVGRYGHTVSLQWLEKLGARLVGHVRDVEGARVAFADDLAANIRFADERAAEFERVLADGVAAQGLDRVLPPIEPDPANEPHPDPDSVRSPDWLDLDEAGIGVVIWSTGFGGRFDWLSPEILDERGVPRHDGVSTPVPGLYVLGFPWLTKRKSGIIHGVDEDARTLTDLLAAHLAS